MPAGQVLVAGLVDRVGTLRSPDRAPRCQAESGSALSGVFGSAGERAGQFLSRCQPGMLDQRAGGRDPAGVARLGQVAQPVSPSGSLVSLRALNTDLWLRWRWWKSTMSPYDPVMFTTGTSAKLRGCLAAVVLVLAAMAAGGCATSVPLAGSYSYGCCVSHPSATLWRPGQMMRIPWTAIREPQGSARARAYATLTLVLIGPFANTSAASTAITAGLWFDRPAGYIPVASATISATTRAATSPISVLRIPRTAPSGFYDLEFETDFGSGSGGGSTQIHVVS